MRAAPVVCADALVLGDEMPLGILETFCREDLPLAVGDLKAEGELERVETGLAASDVSFAFLASLGRREVEDAGDEGDIGEPVSSLSSLSGLSGLVVP